MDDAPIPGVPEVRRTARSRPLVTPEPWPGPVAGYPVTDEYVRTFWTAVAGPGAVADLLRLAAAAAGRRPLRRPVHLGDLARLGLVRETPGALWVRHRIPRLRPEHLRRLPPGIRRRHRSVPPPSGNVAPWTSSPAPQHSSGTGAGS